MDHQQSHIFSYLSPEQRVRKGHPLRAVRAMTDDIFQRMSPLFDAMYAQGGRPSIAPEKLLRALLLQMLYSVRSERLLMEEIDYSVLFRWFVGLNLDDAVWDATTFTKNRERLLEGAVAKEFLAQVVEQARVRGWVSEEHFTVDGTLLEAWASLKSFQPKEGSQNTPPDDRGNPTVDFHGQKRSNETHESTTDVDAKLARKGPGKEAKLSYSGNLLIENRNGLIVNGELLEANGRAERGCSTHHVGADFRYASGDGRWRQRLRHRRVRCRVPAYECDPARSAEHCSAGGSAIDRRTTRHVTYEVSQRKRETDRGMLRLAEGYRPDTQAQASRIT